MEYLNVIIGGLLMRVAKMTKMKLITMSLLKWIEIFPNINIIQSF